ncbi:MULTISPECIES: hypothetical protein [unclassified Rhizobacter]|uniref:hypothetical protein n=1 Tax=unclassified Rhizobacter TaxID=2640088 RepID=UPI0012FB1B6E|nr:MULTISPECIES: hypothetical protein [unclassified Rhizobacter]
MSNTQIPGSPRTKESPRWSPEKEKRGKRMTKKLTSERKNSGNTIASVLGVMAEPIIPSVALTEEQQKKWEHKKNKLKLKDLSSDQIGRQKQILADLGIPPLKVPAKDKKTKSSSIPQSPGSGTSPHLHRERDLAPTSPRRGIPATPRSPRGEQTPRTKHLSGLDQKLSNKRESIAGLEGEIAGLQRQLAAAKKDLNLLQQKRDQEAAILLHGSRSSRQSTAQGKVRTDSSASETDISAIVQTLEREDRHGQQ